jgi:uncharacterized protein
LGARVRVGFALQPDEEFLARVEPILAEHADYLEVTPETTWRPGADGALLANGFHRRFRALGAALGKPFVAHGVGFSLGGFAPADERRRTRWLARMHADQAEFRYGWWTDHLGVTAPGGLDLALPLGLPMTDTAAMRVRASLRSRRAVVPDVGFENTALPFVLGRPADEPRFFAEILAEPGTHLLLDLHNLHVHALNFGVDPDAWLAALDLARVIEIHVSGGAWSDPAWTHSRRRLRLDSHDGDVPEEVWRMLRDVAPRCSNLRGVTLERMEGTVGDDDVPRLRADLVRLHEAVA